MGVNRFPSGASLLATGQRATSEEDKDSKVHAGHSTTVGSKLAWATPAQRYVGSVFHVAR